MHVPFIILVQCCIPLLHPIPSASSLTLHPVFFLHHSSYFEPRPSCRNYASSIALMPFALRIAASRK